MHKLGALAEGNPPCAVNYFIVFKVTILYMCKMLKLKSVCEKLVKKFNQKA